MSHSVAVSRFRYQILTVRTRLYDGQVVDALTLMAPQGSLVKDDGRGRDGASSALGVTGAVQPSERYLNILKEGKCTCLHSVHYTLILFKSLQFSVQIEVLLSHKIFILRREALRIGSGVSRLVGSGQTL